MDKQNKITHFVRANVQANISYFVEIALQNDNLFRDHHDSCLYSYYDYLTKKKGFSNEESYENPYEYHIVTWDLSQLLKVKGEMLMSWCNLDIWGRFCTGQAIYLDSVITEVYKEFGG